MTDIADAQSRVRELFESLSNGDDAERRVGDIEQLAELNRILDGLETEAAEPSTDPENPEVPAEPEPEREPVAAGATQTIVPAPAPAVPAVPEVRHTVRYRVDNPEGGERLGSKNALGQAMSETFASLKRSGRPGQTLPMFSFRATGVDVDENGKVEAEVAKARAEAVLARSAANIATLAAMTPVEAARTRVEAGSGFCAVPTPVHEFCETDADAGRLDLATFVMPPAGVRLPSEPDIMPIYDNLACLTEAEEIAREDPKPCWTIECGDWIDITPCLLPLCIEVGTLTRWAFPELIDKVLAEALKKYEQFINRNNINAIANSPGTLTLDFSAMLKTGALNDIISAVLIAASQFRTKWRLDPSFPLRLVAPSFVGDVLASDGSRRAQDTEMLGLARAIIETTLAKQFIEVVWVYDYQDAQADADPAGWGGTAGGTAESGGYKVAWPTTADMLLFAPDSWQEYREELVRVQGLRQESTLLRDNKELALFIESAHATVQRCKETLLLRVPLCPAGTQQIQEWDPTTACPI